MKIKARLVADGNFLGLCDVEDHTTLIAHNGVIFVRDGANQFLVHKRGVTVVNFNSTAVETIDDLEEL